MTNTVLIKRSSSANAVPSSGNLLPGELAINYNDGNLFYKNTSNIITVIASNQFTSVAGNVTGGNLLTGGIVSATGNINGGNLLTAGVISANGNITADYFIGNGSQLTGVSVATVTANAQPNITSVGTLSSLSVSGNVTSDSTVFAYGLAGNRSNVTITTGTEVDTFLSTTFRGAKYLIKGGDGSDYQVSDVLLVHNGTDAFITINTVCSNAISDIFSVSANVNAGNVILSATKISLSTTTVNLVATYVKD